MVHLQPSRLFSIADFEKVARGKAAAALSTGAKRRVKESFESLLRLLERKGESIYGIHTGFGALQSFRGVTDWGRHQRELVLTHACGVGEPMAEEESRGMVYLRALQISRGYSGVQPAVLEKYLALLKAPRMPRVPSQGSVGASGDLAPLAHAAKAVFARLKDSQIGPRDGLGLINGTEASTAAALLAALSGRRLLESTLPVAALTLFAVRGKTEAWDARLIELKKHPASWKIAERLRDFLGGYRASGLPQDPYSLRAVPQILGCAAELADQALAMITREASSSTDNPAFFPGSRKGIAGALHGANFHGIYPAAGADQMAWALQVAGQTIERRTAFLLSGVSGLPSMLACTPGSAGLMMTQVVQAALSAENRLLSQPASAHSIPTSGNQEDVVPMAMLAASKLKRISFNYSRVLAVEAIAAARAVYSAGRVRELARKTRLGSLWEELEVLAGPLIRRDGEEMTQVIEKLAKSLRG